jgi:fructose-bisphosphate aldolase class I
LASARLHAMNVKFKSRMPWALTFSFSRAVQQPALDLWKGQAANVAQAQKALVVRTGCNKAARSGRYDARADAPQ